MLNKLRKPFNPIINLIAKPFSFLHPNILSFVGPILSIPGFYFYTQGDTLLGSLFIIGAMFDMIDGAVARMTNKGSKFGGILDATLDRLFDGALVISIGIGAIVAWEYLAIFLTISLGVSYIKSKAEAVSATEKVGTNQFSVGIAERGERIALIFLGSILNHIFTEENNEILKYTFVILIILSLITLIWRAVVIKKVVDQLD